MSEYLTHCIIDRKRKIRNWNLGMDFPNKKMEHNYVEQGTDFQLKSLILYLFAIATGSLHLEQSISATHRQFYLVRNQRRKKGGTIPFHCYTEILRNFCSMKIVLCLA